MRRHLYWPPLMRAARRAALLSAVLLAVGVIASTDLQRMERLAEQRYGPATGDLVAQWRMLVDDIADLPVSERLQRVNRFFNRQVRWRQDIDIWGQNDYWATPLETMGRREGDCEDFSVSKYMTLVLAGVPVEQLRITYVKAQMGGPSSNISQAHMVLAWYETPGAEPLILDNLISEIRPASRREDLKPVFGFNTQGLWVGSATQAATRDPGARLSRWRDLLQRMAEDGLSPSPLTTE